jgi:uncharacterized protein
MAKLSLEIKKALTDSELLPLATASAAGTPNVVPIKFVFVEDEDCLWLVDNYLTKTLANIIENPFAALYVYRPEQNLCIQIKGTLEVRTTGPDYERMRQRVHSIRTDLPAKSLVVMRVTDLYQCMPGPNAGAKIEL